VASCGPARTIGANREAAKIIATGPPQRFLLKLAPGYRVVRNYHHLRMMLVHRRAGSSRLCICLAHECPSLCMPVIVRSREVVDVRPLVYPDDGVGRTAVASLLLRSELASHAWRCVAIVRRSRCGSRRSCRLLPRK
jgi:hypothetical protein